LHACALVAVDAAQVARQPVAWQRSHATEAWRQSAEAGETAARVRGPSKGGPLDLPTQSHSYGPMSSSHSFSSLAGLPQCVPFRGQAPVPVPKVPWEVSPCQIWPRPSQPGSSLVIWYWVSESGSPFTGNISCSTGSCACD
jgi:hypothetical protein